MASQISISAIFVSISVLVVITSGNELLQRRQRQAVVDTVTTQDEIVGPGGISVPIASVTNTQFQGSPVAGNIPQVFDTIQTQDSVITPTGAQIPVASSTDIQRVARQFVNSANRNPQVVDTVTVQDEIIGPDGISVPVASATNTQVSPVAGNIPQVIDTIQTQDSVITPTGAQIPVASSTDIQRVARQFVNSVNRNPQAVVDTVTVQDTVVDPVSGMTVPVGGTSNTVVSPAVAPVVRVPQVIDTVQTQDTIISPDGREIPVSSSSQTQVSPAVVGQPQVFDTVSVQDSIVADNGAVIPVASSVQSRALPMFQQAFPANYGSFYAQPRTMNTMAVQDSVMTPNGQMIPVGGASQTYASPAVMPMQPYYHPRFYRREFHDKGHQHSEVHKKTVDEDLRDILAPVRADSKDGDSSSSSQEKKNNNGKKFVKNASESSNSSEPALLSHNFTSKAQTRIHSSKSHRKNNNTAVQTCNSTTVHEPATTGNISSSSVNVFISTKSFSGEKNATEMWAVNATVPTSFFNTTDFPPSLNATTTIVIEKTAKVILPGNSLLDEEFPATAADLEHAAEKVVILPKSAFVPNNETVFSDFVGNETLH